MLRPTSKCAGQKFRAKSPTPKRRLCIVCTSRLRQWCYSGGGIELQRGPHDPYELSNLKNALAAALDRSEFAASPLDRQPRLRRDREPMEVVLELQAQLRKKSRT
ncbi:hypothetical protein GGD66_006560 [Bradyrhizobium sp. CIR48]|nr:hypothetical protein [Bradyrhizobium sp. CIR48]